MVPPRSSPDGRPAAHLDASGPVPVVVVDVTGWLDVETAGPVHDVLRDAIDRRPPRLLVDVSACELADGYGLRMLVAAQRRAARRGTELELVGVGRRLRRVLRITGLDEVLTPELTEVGA